MYDELVRRLRKRAEYFDYDGWVETASDYEKAADAIEELSKLADAIPHVCECCIGCEIESGGCDNAFVLSPKRVREYLSKSRWISVTERLPELYQPVLVCVEMIGKGRMYGVDYRLDNITWAKSGEFWKLQITHWMPLPQPPKEEAE